MGSKNQSFGDKKHPILIDIIFKTKLELRIKLTNCPI